MDTDALDIRPRTTTAPEEVIPMAKLKKALRSALALRMPGCGCGPHCWELYSRL